MPQPLWIRHQGHVNDPEEEFYSFTKANQDYPILFGMDTTTEEGRKLFEAEYLALAECAPEIIDKDDIVYPHEIQQRVTQEAHFLRLWKIYQGHTLKEKAKQAVADGTLSSEDMHAAAKFLGAKGSQLSVAAYAYAKAGVRPGLKQDEGFLAADRVMKAIGMELPINLNSA